MRFGTNNDNGASGFERREQASDALLSRSTSEHLKRLEERIRDFHARLSELDSDEDPAQLFDTTETPIEVPQARPVPAEATAPRAAEASNIAPTPRSEGSGAARGDEERRPGAPSRSPIFGSGRRLDALGPAATGAPDPTPRDRVEDVLSEARRDAEDIRRRGSADADGVRADAAREAAALRASAQAEAATLRAEIQRERDQAEAEMQRMWQTLDSEVQAIQIEVSNRVDRLAEKMEAVTLEAGRTRARAVEDGERIRADAEAESERLISAARSAAETVRRRAVANAERDAQEARDVLSQQIREAAVGAIQRINRAQTEMPDPLGTTGSEGPGDTVEDVLNGLGVAVSLIERCLEGLAEIAADSDVG